MPHLPCSLDLSLSDFFLFPLMKKVLKGKHFADVEEVKQEMAKALKGLKSTSPNTVLSSEKNVSIGVFHQMERILKVTDI